MGVNVTYTVYMHTDPDGKKYIGITKRDVKDRWNNGFGYASNKDLRFFDAIRKFGWDNIKHEIIASDLSKEKAIETEAELIPKYKTTNPEFGYNIADGKRRKKNDGEKWIASFRATTDLGNKLQDIADKECRTVNNLMVYIITKYVEQYYGYDEDDEYI